MIFAFALVGNRLHAAVTPLCLHLARLAAIKRVKAARIERLRAVQPLEEVLHRRVFRLIPQQDDRVPFKEKPDETCRPALGEICPSKVRAAQNEIIRSAFISPDPSMQIGEPGNGLLMPEVGKYRRLEYLRALRDARVLKQAVKNSW
jgi:hypothetical protein